MITWDKSQSPTANSEDLVAGERILILDENPEKVEVLLTNVLLPQGYLAQATDNAHAGLRAAQEERPDLVLLGLSVNGMPYNEILQRLRVFGDPPVIMLMPSGTEAQALQAIRLGARDALIEPVGAKEMAAIIARVLHRERLAGERDWFLRKLAGFNDTLEQSLAKTQTLYNIGKTISSTLNLQDVLTAVVHAAVSLTQSEEGYVLLGDLEGNELYLRAIKNLGERYATGLCIRVEDSIGHHVARTREPVVLCSGDAASIRIEAKQALGSIDPLVRSLVNVPLCSQTQVLGVLGIANVTNKRSFGEGDVKLLCALADSAALAINNAQVFARTDETLGRVLAEVSAAQYKTEVVLQNISDGVFTVDKDLRITSVNPAMERITGWQESELLGRRYEELFAPKVDTHRLEAAHTILSKALHSLSPLAATRSTILRKDDRRIPIVGTAAPLRSADRSIIGVLATMRDISRDTRSDVLDTLQSGNFFDPLTEGTLHSLHLEAGEAPPNCHPITLRPVISQVVKRLQEEMLGISFEVALATDLPFGVGNESKVELALINLILNALEMGDPGKPIRISAEANEDSVIVVVEGPGLDPKRQDQAAASHVYDNQNPSDGNHLLHWATPQIRLFIASKLIQTQGGRVWAEHRPGTGACFRFSLPKVEVGDVTQALID
jgi:PAS domain S-box-containing protein